MNMKNRILLGVYAIYCMRKLKSPLVVESFILAILATTLLYFVSIPSVLMNMRTSGNSYQYFLTAFSGADLLTKSALVLVGVMGLFFARNIRIYTGLKQRFT